MKKHIFKNSFALHLSCQKDYSTFSKRFFFFAFPESSKKSCFEVYSPENTISLNQCYQYNLKSLTVFNIQRIFNISMLKFNLIFRFSIYSIFITLHAADLLPYMQQIVYKANKLCRQSALNTYYISCILYLYLCCLIFTLYLTRGVK